MRVSPLASETTFKSTQECFAAPRAKVSSDMVLRLPHGDVERLVEEVGRQLARQLCETGRSHRAGDGAEAALRRPERLARNEPGVVAGIGGRIERARLAGAGAARSAEGIERARLAGAGAARSAESEVQHRRGAA